MEDALERIEEVTRSLNNMNESKDSIMDSIHNISAVSQQTAAWMEEVAAAGEEQSAAM